MRALERDRLLARVAWVYLIGLAAVSAYYLWPRPLPNVVAEDVVPANLPVKTRIDFDAVRSVTVRAIGATPAVAARVMKIVEGQGGNSKTLAVAVADREALLATLAALREVSKDEPHVTFVLRFAPTDTAIRLNRGSFDDPDGLIGRALLERKKARQESTTATASSTTAEGGAP